MTTATAASWCRPGRTCSKAPRSSTSPRRPPNGSRAPGYVRGKSLTLVRNPSWEAATDDLRPAYPDRIELPMTGTAEEDSRKVDRGELDLVFDANAPVDQVARYRTDPELSKRTITVPCDWVFAIPMNLAVRPFDDIHVRKAVSLAINKAGLRRLLNARPFWWGYAWGIPTGHIAIDAITENLLVGYDPYRTPARQRICGTGQEPRWPARATTKTATASATTRPAEAFASPRGGRSRYPRMAAQRSRRPRADWDHSRCARGGRLTTRTGRQRLLPGKQPRPLGISGEGSIQTAPATSSPGSPVLS